ncbi:MAG: 4'-phosphopantetheinyl transferase superfamily protein [Proteobacteria bacterium]|nr:4'-phosphopantetheinyl transferase superfamily protein [Pseudomonadota bacterium]
MEVKLGNSFLSANRRTEFFSGRRCAHQAMTMAGFPNLPILRDYDRSPVWPLTLVGSITHGSSLAAAIVRKPHAGLLGLGIDIEDLSREIRTKITRHTLTPWEIDRWSDANACFNREARIIFSIKETIYKCFHPVNKVYLGFHDAEVTDLDESRFQARLLKNPFLDPTRMPIVFEGKVAIHKNIVFTALQIARDRFPIGYTIE